MIKPWSRPARFALLTAILTAAGGLLVALPSHAQTPAAQTAQPDAAVFKFAETVSKLIEHGDIEGLAKFNATGTAPTPVLGNWTSEYVSQVKKQAEQRDKQYADAMGKAQDELKRESYDKASGSLVLAYRIAKDPEAFLQQDWVINFTNKLAARATELEKKGQWLESLDLFTNLNTLYEVDTRYKADMQRLTRRTRLVAVYTPRALYDMRKAMIKAEKDAEAKNPTTKPAVDGATTKPADTTADDDDAAAFTRWQDLVENISVDMMSDAIERSVQDWVEKTDYPTMVKGGVESLRLFLTTPELAKEFPGLADAHNRAAFDDALNQALAADPTDVGKIVKNIIKASNLTVRLPDNVIVMEFTDGAMEKLDPFTAVIWPHEVDEFEKNTRGSFGGVGIQISLEGGQLKVISPLEDTPAYRAKIQAGDVITSIDGKSTVGISIDQAVHSIMGTPGTEVKLKIKRGTDPDKEFVITRAIIKVSSVKGYRREPSDPNHAAWDFMLDQDNKIGYIRITGFQDDTPDELRRALIALQNQGMRGIILDLRFNPGGLLQAAVEMSDMFLTEGTIVSTRGRSIRAREQKLNAHSDTVIPPNMPMVVLVNEYAASASEIFSGAMKDLSRALIVGHRTFGKGSVQNLLKVGEETRTDGNPMAMMKLTMAYYYLPKGESLHRRDGQKTWGVDPDVVVDLTPEQLGDLIKTSRDRDIITADTPPSTTAPATVPAAVAATKDTPSADTQLNTALLLMRLQLVQSSL
jgi:carboxyl-terminal processing protease